MFLDEDDLRTCHLSHKRYLCHVSQVIYDVAMVPTCEVELLRYPSKDLLRTCDIRITYDQISDIRYSLTSPELAHLICSKTPDQKYILEKTGLIQMAPGCSLKTESATIPAITLKEDPQEYLYETQLSLDLTELSPIISKHRDYLDSPLNNVHDSKPTWQGSDADTTLMDLEKKLTALSQHRLEIREHYHYTHSAIGGVIFLILGFIIYLSRSYINIVGTVLLRCIKRNQRQIPAEEPAKLYTTVSRPEPANRTTNVNNGSDPPQEGASSSNPPNFLTRMPSVPCQNVAVP